MKRPSRSGSQARDRGAAAVEFALCLPLLLLLVFGIIDFGRALNAQITLSQAAREGVMLAAEGDSSAAVQARAEAAAPELGAISVTIATACAPNAGPAADAQVDVSYSFSFITPVGAIAGLIGGSGFGSPITLTAQGVMPCET